MERRHFNWTLGVVFAMAAVIFTATMLSVRLWTRDACSRQAQHSSAVDRTVSVSP
jgi:hypothetical protein